MKKVALIAAVAATLAAPAFAQSASDFAVTHFNQDQDSVIEQITTVSHDNVVAVSSRSMPAMAEAIAQLNSTQDSVSDLRGSNGVTLVSGEISAGAEIFEALSAE